KSIICIGLLKTNQQIYPSFSKKFIVAAIVLSKTVSLKKMQKTITSFRKILELSLMSMVSQNELELDYFIKNYKKMMKNISKLVQVKPE
ncbi:hypothetical protein L9F63_001066, partial [Diploptera punctata]